MKVLCLLLIVFFCCLVKEHRANGASVIVNEDELIFNIPSHFCSHGWEPFTALGFIHQNMGDPIISQLLSNLGGGAVRFGGITADFLAYFENPTEISACKYTDYPAFTGVECPFSTGTFDYLLDLLSGANMKLLFNFNELTGRDCTQVALKPWQPDQYCGNDPAPWNTSAVSLLLNHIRALGRDDELVGFELGNELFQPPHLPQETAAEDVKTFAGLVTEVWGSASHPDLFASGTNDCARSSDAPVMAAVDAVMQGFSFHNYPMGDGVDGQDPDDPLTYLLNSTWLRTQSTGNPQKCLDLWESGGYKAKGAKMVVTETNAHAPAIFAHTFFSVSMMGQYARMGVDFIGRWSMSQLIHQDKEKGAWEVAADYYLDVLFIKTMGSGVLGISGDEESDVLVYAHCSPEVYTSGSVTLMVANPSNETVKLSVSLPTIPRDEFVLTSPFLDVDYAAPLLNGQEPVLSLNADGTLPPMDPWACNVEGECPEAIDLPPVSVGFYLLKGAGTNLCMN